MAPLRFIPILLLLCHYVSAALISNSPTQNYHHAIPNSFQISSSLRQSLSSPHQLDLQHDLRDDPFDIDPSIREESATDPTTQNPPSSDENTRDGDNTDKDKKRKRDPDSKQKPDPDPESDPEKKKPKDHSKNPDKNPPPPSTTDDKDKPTGDDSTDKQPPKKTDPDAPNKPPEQPTGSKPPPTQTESDDDKSLPKDKDPKQKPSNDDDPTDSQPQATPDNSIAGNTSLIALTSLGVVVLIAALVFVRQTSLCGFRRQSDHSYEPVNQEGDSEITVQGIKGQVNDADGWNDGWDHDDWDNAETEKV